MNNRGGKSEDSLEMRNIPLEYWEACDARQGGVVGGISEKGLSIRSDVDMYVGGTLDIWIFFSLGNGFDRFQVLAKIVGKDLCLEEAWETYEYQLEFIRMSEEDRLKLRDLLRIRKLRSALSGVTETVS